MNKDQATRKLAANQAATKRWHSRLVRATNALGKLARQRRRLEGILAKPEPASAPAASVKAKVSMEAVPVIRTDDPDLVEKVKAALDRPKDGLDMPVFLQRSKKQGTDEERRAMPLSGNAAAEYIKAKSAKVTAKREKRDRAFHKKA